MSCQYTFKFGPNRGNRCEKPAISSDVPFCSICVTKEHRFQPTLSSSNPMINNLNVTLATHINELGPNVSSVGQQ